ncbi:MAG: helix-turn-helix transcriptional regulator [Actinomycetota bacterium]
MARSDAAPGRRRSTKSSERLRRLLVMVPYVVRHPGTELSEVARLFAATEEELLDDLRLLFMSGLPPYGPGDLIDVDIQDGRVWIEMADYFARPLRLTRNEAVSLYLRGTALTGAPGLQEATALTSALGKLEEGLGRETLGELAGRVATAAGRPSEAPEMLEPVRAAVQGRERLEIQYYAASTAETTVRRIDPEEVFFAIGNWYVVAWDHLSGEERLLRVDRIKSAEATGERFEPRGLAGAGRPLYTPGERGVAIRLLLHPEARWVAEYYWVESETEREDGSLEVVLPAGRVEWVARLLVRLGGGAEILDPPGLKDLVRDLARRTLEQYERSSPDDSSQA